jgi:hypothetical protein
MSTIHLRRTTTATPEQYVAGLTDFGPGRSKLFGNSADAYLKVHHREGSQRAARRVTSTPSLVGLTERPTLMWLSYAMART